MSGYSTYSQQQEDIRAAQQKIGLAEIRVRQLQEQLAACEKALAERDAEVLALRKELGPSLMLIADLRMEVSSYKRLVWGGVHNAGRLLTSGRVPRWAAVKEALGVGSTTAHELCREHQLDPDELVGKGDLCGGCDLPGLGGMCGDCVCAPEDQPFCTRETLCGCAKEEE